MATKYFLVQQDVNAATCRKEGVDAMVVVAETSADALAMAASKTDGDSKALWLGATATELIVAANLDGWTLTVTISKPNGDVLSSTTVVGVGGATVDTIAALMVTALNATAAIANASYNAGTNVLTVAAIADNIGDHSIAVAVKPPAATHGSPLAIPGFVGTIVDEGVAGAVLTVALAADAYTKPKVMATVKQVA
jgi:hypothetical protein